LNNILYVCPNAKRAGAEQVTALLSQYHRKPWKPHVFFLTDGPLVDELKQLGINCHVHSQKPRLKNIPSVYKCAKNIVQIIKNEKIRLVHSVTGYGHIFGGIAAQMARVPEVWFQHGPTGNLDWITGRVPTRLILVNSRFTLGEERKYFIKLLSPRIRVLYPGTENFSPSQFESQGVEFRKNLGISEDDFVFGIMGRICPMKGQKLFLEAAARINHKKTKFVIIGAPYMASDNTYFEQVKVLAQALGLDALVSWAGFVPYPQYKALAACDVVVNASTVPEPFGLTLIESMMLERAVIAPHAGGPEEIVTHSTDGYLFKPGDVEDLARAMENALNSNDLGQIGKNARKTVIERFLINRMVEELESEYDHLLKESRV
jgi:glycosyltransferase involved in cell wall biosynthesis